jgi:hypothetical protein
MTITALTSGMFGIMVASYGNAVLGSMPTSMMIYTSMALMLNAEVLDKDSTTDIPPVKLSASDNKLVAPE